MQSITGKTILVTGATGFVGSRLTEVLSQEQGVTITALGRNLDRIRHLRDKGVHLVSLDIRSIESLEGVVEGHDLVFHTAAVMDADPGVARQVNEEATAKLVQIAGESGVSRLIHMSTVGAYDMPVEMEVDETTPLALNHPATYPRTKARGENRATQIARKYDLELAIVRPSMIYGPGYGFWTVGIYEIIRKGNPSYLGDGSANFNPVYIDDVVNALIQCAISPKAAGESFNLSAEVTSWNNFMSYYGDLCKKEPKGMPLLFARLISLANRIPGVRTPIDQGFIEMATSRKRFPIDKAARLLDWQPKVDLEEGMRRTRRWLKDKYITE